MASQIPFDALQGNQLTPDVAVETNLTAGLNGLPDLTKNLLHVGAKLAAGSAADGDIDKITSTEQAGTLYGKGSRLYGMIVAAFRQAPRVPMWAMSQPEGTTKAGLLATVGGSGKFTLTGTATKAGTFRADIAGKTYNVGVAVGDIATVVRTNLRAIIDADPERYITTADEDTAGTHIELQARNGGPEGNSITMRIQSFGVAGMTAVADGAKLTGGATYGAHDFSNLEVQRFELLCSDSDDPTASTGIFAKALAHQETMSEPLNKKWGMVVAGEGSTISTAGTLADIGTLSYRGQVCHLQSAPNPSWELAAALAAERARVVDPSVALDDVVLKGILAPYAKKDYPTATEVETALQAGLTVLRPTAAGTVEIVRSIVTRQTQPIAYHDHNPTEISDLVDDDLIRQMKLKHKSKVLKTLSPGNTPKTVTPKRALQTLHERMRLWDSLDYTEGADADIEAGRTAAERNATNFSRLDVAYPFRPVFRAHQIFILKTFTTPDIV